MLLTRKNALFAGHDGGAENWALFSSIVATCKLNDINPVAYITNTLEAILDGHPGHPKNRTDDLIPWRFIQTSSLAALVADVVLTSGSAIKLLRILRRTWNGSLRRHGARCSTSRAPR
jgi:hypothetical protein